MNVTLNPRSEDYSSKDTLHRTAVARVINAMRANLYDPMSLENMADIACFSPFHFNRVFKAVTGIPPNQFLYALRLDHAKRLLLTTKLNVTDICFEVGYNSLGSFTYRFTSLVGLSPNAFRKFAQQFDGFVLDSIRELIAESSAVGRGQGGPHGYLELPERFEGLVFIGLFRRAIPERQPVACLLRTRERAFKFPSVPLGQYYLFSVALPWDADSVDLLTLYRAYRGRSAKMTHNGQKSSGPANLKLRPFDELHPPILAALPVLVFSKLAAQLDPFSTECEEAKCAFEMEYRATARQSAIQE